VNSANDSAKQSKAFSRNNFVQHHSSLVHEFRSGNKSNRSIDKNSSNKNINKKSTSINKNDINKSKSHDVF